MVDFLGSEYRKISNYLDSNKVGSKKNIPDKKPVRADIALEPVFIPYRKWFNISNVTSENLQTYLKSCIESEINEDLKYSKAFYTCDDVCNCPRKLYYSNSNYKVGIQQLYNNTFISDLLFQNNRKIILELLNFEVGSFVVEDNVNKLKSVIYGTFENTLFDFTNPINFELVKLTTQLKCYLYRLTNPSIDKICLFLFTDHISEIRTYTFDFDENLCIDLISKFKHNQQIIKTNKKPECDNRFCYNCLYKQSCKKIEIKSLPETKNIDVININENTPDESIEVLDEYKDKKKKPGVKNIFLI